MISYNPLDTYPTFKQSNTYKLNIQVLDELRQPQDLSGLAGAVYMFADTNKSSAIITKTLGDGIEIIESEQGTLEITLNATDTAIMPEGLGYHECSIYTEAGTAHTVLDENVIIEEQLINLQEINPL